MIFNSLSFDTNIIVSENFDLIDKIIQDNIHREFDNIYLPIDCFKEIFEIFSSSSFSSNKKIKELIKVSMILEKEDKIVFDKDKLKILKFNKNSISYRERFRRYFEKINLDKDIINNHIALLTIEYLERHNKTIPDIYSVLSLITERYLSSKIEDLKYQVDFIDRNPAELFKMYFHINLYSLFNYFSFYFLQKLTQGNKFYFKLYQNLNIDIENLPLLKIKSLIKKVVDLHNLTKTETSFINSLSEENNLLKFRILKDKKTIERLKKILNKINIAINFLSDSSTKICNNIFKCNQSLIKNPKQIDLLNKKNYFKGILEKRENRLNVLFSRKENLLKNIDNLKSSISVANKKIEENSHKIGIYSNRDYFLTIEKYNKDLKKYLHIVIKKILN